MINVDKQKLQEYIDIVQKVARVEYRRIPAHMLDLEELVSIGVIAIQVLVKNKTPEQLAKYNAAYVATAVRWAMRNELRIRYKWYSLKHKEEEGEEESLYDESDPEAQKAKVRESIYETILSIDGLAAAASDNDSPFDFVKDPHEITELAKMIKEAIANLPPKERTVVEYRFYRNMQVKDIATQVGLSSSRVTRIVQAALVSIKQYLNAREQYGY